MTVLCKMITGCNKITGRNKSLVVRLACGMTWFDIFCNSCKSVDLGVHPDDKRNHVLVYHASPSHIRRSHRWFPAGGGAEAAAGRQSGQRCSPPHTSHVWPSASAGLQDSSQSNYCFNQTHLFTAVPQKSYQCHCWSCPRCCWTLHGGWFFPPWMFAPLSSRSRWGHSSPERQRSGGSCCGSWNTSLLNWLTQHLLQYSEWHHFLPVRKAVGSGQDPTCRDQTPATPKNTLLALAAPEDGSDPRVGFYSGHGSTNNLHQLPPGTAATGGLHTWETKTGWI